MEVFVLQKKGAALQVTQITRHSLARAGLGFTLWLCFLWALPQNKYWVKNYKFGTIQEAKGVFAKNSGITLIGSYGNYPSLLWQGYIAQIDNQGNILDSVIYVNPTGTFVFQDISGTNNNFYCTGYSYTPLPIESQQIIVMNSLNMSNVFYVGTDSLKPGGRSIMKTPPNNYIIVGQATDDWQPYAVKVDTAGTIIWEQVYDTYPLLNWLTDIIPVPNEDAFYVMGSSGVNMFYGDILLAKISNSNGEMLWDTIYDFEGVDLSGRIIKSQYGGYIAGSLIRGFGIADQKGAVIKFDNNFNIIWLNDQLFYECGAATVNELLDGNIITSGCDDPEGEYAQMQIIKLSGADGSILWRRTYGGSWHDYAYDLALAPDGGFLVAGRQDAIIPGAPIGHASAWLLKLNCMGLLTQPQAAFSYYPLDNNAIQFINETQYAYPDSIDGGYYVWDFGDGTPPYLCGQGYEPCTGNILTHQYAAPGAYPVTLTAIVCTDTSFVQALIDTQGAGGTVGIAPPHPPLASEGGSFEVLVYPNPAQNILTLQWVSKSPLGDLGVRLLTLTGQTVLETTLAAGEASKTFSVAHLPAGIYLCRWQQLAGGASGYVKVVVMR